MFRIRDYYTFDILFESNKITENVLKAIDGLLRERDIVDFYENDIYICSLFIEDNFKSYLDTMIEQYIDTFFQKDNETSKNNLFKVTSKAKKIISKDLKEEYFE